MNKELLKQYAEQYETAEFLNGDPSWFMHQVSGDENQEAMAFIAASLSFGSRLQFMKKIQVILLWTRGDVDAWVRTGRYAEHLKEAGFATATGPYFRNVAELN